MTSLPFQDQQARQPNQPFDAANDASCPHCGFPLARPRDAAAADVESQRRRADDERRVAELTREVQHLRATVARLRGTGTPTPTH